MRFRLILFLIVATSAAAAGEPERLLNVRDMYPSVSLDSHLLVFQSNRTGTNQIYRTQFGLASSDNVVEQLTNAALGAETPVVSPDGNKIALAIYLADGNNDVFVMNVDGSDLRQLTFGPGYDGHPHWSADGSRIAFNSDRTTPDRDAAWSDRWHEIFSMKADGSDIRQHTKCRSVCTYGSLSPDGSKLLYRKVIAVAGLDWALNDIDSNSEIFVSDLDGNNELNLSRNKAFDGWPIWSPDGKRIAFASNRSGPALTGHVWTINPDGSDPVQLTSGEWSYAQPAWSLDGNYIFAYQNVEAEDYEFGSVVRMEIGKK